MSKPSRSRCRNCGRAVMWHPDLDRRPIETDPSPVTPGDPGFVVTRNRHTGALTWVPTECAPDLGLPVATEHLRVHTCLGWQRSSGVSVDRLAVNPDDAFPRRRGRGAA